MKRNHKTISTMKQSAVLSLYVHSQKNPLSFKKK